MDYTFQLQDPSDPETVYLLEAIIQAVDGASCGRGLFAFASTAGVNTFFQDEVASFLADGKFELIVGIDAVTNRAALERLQQLEEEHAGLRVQVFWNYASGLFHPKVAEFRYPSGRRRVIVGSGNLTPGGLQKNFEGYSVFCTEPGESLDVSSWDAFLTRHREDLKRIDGEALERAARNVVRGGGQRQREAKADDVDIEDGKEELEGVATARVLVAQIPGAGGRWHQGHFSRDVVKQFFRVEPHSSQRAYLQERRMDGTLGDQEVRPCGFSQSNKNHRIELGARRDESYPEGSQPPIGVFLELQARVFEYLLLLPNEKGYNQMMRLTRDLPTVGRGFPRVLADAGSHIICPCFS